MNLASEVPRFDPGWGQIFFYYSFYNAINLSMSFEVESHALHYLRVYLLLINILRLTT